MPYAAEYMLELKGSPPVQEAPSTFSKTSPTASTQTSPRPQRRPHRPLHHPLNRPHHPPHHPLICPHHPLHHPLFVQSFSYIHHIVTKFLLGNHHFFLSINDKISTGIISTFPHSISGFTRHSMQYT